MSTHKPVLLLPGPSSAEAAQHFFGAAYEYASYLTADYAHGDAQFVTNGHLKAFGGRKVDLWQIPVRGRAETLTDATQSVIDELARLECQLRIIPISAEDDQYEPHVLRVLGTAPDKVREWARERIKEYGREPGADDDSEAEDTPTRQPIDWPSLEGKTPPERQWIINHWLTHGPTLLAGQGGIGKTHIAQTLGTAIALGRQYVDNVTEPKRVLFWACEDDHDELWRRQIAICRYFDANFTDLSNLIIEPRVGHQNGLMLERAGAPEWQPLIQELRAQVNDYNADVLILDNIGQCFGGNENSRHHVTAFISGLMGLAQRPLSLILLGHPAKANGSEYSGSTAWEAAVRMRWYLGTKLPDQKADEGEEDADENVRYLCKRKANYSRLDYRQLIYNEGVYTCLEHQGVTFREKYASGARRDSAEALILASVRQLYQADIRAVAAENSPDSLIKRMRELHVCQDYTTKELAEALSRLRLAGKVIEAPVGRFTNRMAKRGLATPDTVRLNASAQSEK